MPRLGPSQCKAIADAPLVQYRGKWYGNSYVHYNRTVTSLLDQGILSIDLATEPCGWLADLPYKPHQKL